MKMVYTDNPLATQVFLDASESRMLWHIIRAKELEELLFEVHCHLDAKCLDIDGARNDSDPDYILGDDDQQRSGLEQRVDTLHTHCLAVLQSYHIGDCTCVPCGCSKCYAESLLGLNTLKGLPKHGGHTIMRLFSNDGCTTCAEGIALLESRQTEQSDGAHALAWLRQYQAQHLHVSNDEPINSGE